MNGWDQTRNGMPKPGQSAELSRTTTEADVAAFRDMTGDANPLHFDRVAAEASPFKRLIVQGGVTSGLLNAVVAERLPGPGTVFLEVNWRFVRAVGIGERITARVEVLTVREDKPICTLSTTVRNAAGEDCLTGTATTYTVPLPPAGD